MGIGTAGRARLFDPFRSASVLSQSARRVGPIRQFDSGGERRPRLSASACITAIRRVVFPTSAPGAPLILDTRPRLALACAGSTPAAAFASEGRIVFLRHIR